MRARKTNSDYLFNFKRVLEIDFPVGMLLPMQKCQETCIYSMGYAVLLNSNQQHVETFAAGSGFLTFWHHDNHSQRGGE